MCVAPTSMPTIKTSSRRAGLEKSGCFSVSTEVSCFSSPSGESSTVKGPPGVGARIYPVHPFYRSGRLPDSSFPSLRPLCPSFILSSLSKSGHPSAWSPLPPLSLYSSGFFPLRTPLSSFTSLRFSSFIIQLCVASRSSQSHPDPFFALLMPCSLGRCSRILAFTALMSRL